VAWPACLRRQQPDVPPVSQWRQSVNEGVHEIAVFVPPPQQDDIDHILVILVDELNAVYPGNRLAKLLIAVVVIADLLHHLARLNAEPLGLATFILCLARGRAH